MSPTAWKQDQTFICNKGALRRPLTYDNHRSPPTPTLFALQHPRRHKMTLEVQGRQKDRKTKREINEMTKGLKRKREIDKMTE